MAENVDWDPMTAQSRRDPVGADRRLRQTCPVAYGRIRPPHRRHNHQRSTGVDCLPATHRRPNDLDRCIRSSPTQERQRRNCRLVTGAEFPCLTGVMDD